MTVIHSFDVPRPHQKQTDLGIYIENELEAGRGENLHSLALHIEARHLSRSSRLNAFLRAFARKGLLQAPVCIQGQVRAERKLLLYLFL